MPSCLTATSANQLSMVDWLQLICEAICYSSPATEEFVLCWLTVLGSRPEGPRHGRFQWRSALARGVRDCDILPTDWAMVLGEAGRSNERGVLPGPSWALWPGKSPARATRQRSSATGRSRKIAELLTLLRVNLVSTRASRNLKIGQG